MSYDRVDTLQEILGSYEKARQRGDYGIAASLVTDIIFGGLELRLAAARSTAAQHTKNEVEHIQRKLDGARDVSQRNANLAAAGWSLALILGVALLGAMS